MAQLQQEQISRTAENESFRKQMEDLQERIKTLMLRQGYMLETMAVNELDMRRKRIEADQVKARFALAESYDRASKAQAEQDVSKNLAKPADSNNKDATPAGKTDKQGGAK